jgi:hypothetical protein
MIKKKTNITGGSQSMILTALKGITMKLKNLHITVLLILLGFLPSCVNAFEACYVVQDEEVTRWKIMESKQGEKECSNKTRKDIDAATAVVKAFWLAKKNHISFFSQGYKNFIEANNLLFDDVHKYLFYPERMWAKQKYKTIFYQNDKNMQVIVLSTWSQEGYTGTTTFTFDLVYEQNKWKIDLMIY